MQKKNRSKEAISPTAAAVPIEESNKKGKKKRLSPFLVFNLIQIAFFMAFTIKGFLDSYGDSKYLPIILVLIGVYLISFIFIIALSLRDKDKVKQTSKQYKSGLKDIKLTIRVVNNIMLLINVVTAFLIVLETYSAEPTLFKQIFAVGSAAWALVSAIRSFIKTGFKVRKRVKKARKAKNAKKDEK